MSADSNSRRRRTSRGWVSLVQRNLSLVKYVLSKLSGKVPPSVDRDDLLAAGALGLIEAARRYDAGRRVPFHSYAIPRICGAMLDELRSHDWLSQDMRKQVNRLERRRAQLHQRDNAPPTTEALARDMGCSVERVARLSAVASAEPRHTGAEDDAPEPEERDLCVRLGTAPPRGPYERTAFEEQRRLLALAIAQLPPRERKVVVLRYHEELCLREIGQILGVTESRVSQIHREALRRLSRNLARMGSAP